MNKELAIKIFREAAMSIEDSIDEFACLAIERAALFDYQTYSPHKELLCCWFKPVGSCYAFYSYDENGDQEPYFRAGSEKGKLGRAIMLDLMAEMIETGDVQI